MEQSKKYIYLAITNLFLVFLGVGLIIPVMPKLKDEMHLSGTTMGLLISIFAFFQLIVSPLAGYLSDKAGRKIMIVSGMLIFAVSELIFGLGTNVHWFYLSRALGGIAGAFIMPSVTAYVADMTTLKERAKAMGLVSAAISGGFIIGPGAGGFLASFGMKVPFFAASICAFIGFILSGLILKEPPKQIITEDIQEEVSIWSILKNPNFSSFFLIILISSFGLQAFEAIYSIMAVNNFAFTTSQIAAIITISGLLALICQVFFFNQIIRFVGEIGLIQITFFASAIFIAFIAFTTSKWVVIFSTFVVFLAFDLFRPAVTTYLSKKAGKHQGTVNGLNSTFTSIGNIIGPIGAGYMFDVNDHLPYYISALILLITGFLSLLLRRNIQK